MGFLDRHFRRRSSRPDLQRILDALQGFIRAPTWAESRRILEQHPELLDGRAEVPLEALAQAQPDPQARQAVEEHRTLLRRCREVGIDAAFAEITSTAGEPETGPRGGPRTVPLAFQTDLRRAVEAWERYSRTSDGKALDEAVAACERILRHPDFTASGPDFRLAALSDAGATYLRRYWARGHAEDLDRALGLSQRAVELTPEGSPYLPSFLNNLGTGLRERYARTGELPDLEKGIHSHERAVELTPEGSPDLPGFLNNLGLGLSERYARTGELPDLEKGIHSHERAVELTLEGSPDLPRHLSNLGNGLRERYARTGELPDLEKTIRDYERAVELTPEGSPDLPRHLSNLGVGLSELYARTGELPDLEKAIHNHERAVELTLEGSPDLPGFVANLGIGLTERYARTGELPDLEEGILNFQRAVELTPPGSPDLPSFLNNLGNGLRERYARTGELPDLEKGIDSHERVVELTPEGSPDLPGFLNNLGNGLRERYARTRELPDLEKALAAWERAWSFLQTTFVAVPVAYKLGQQRRWAPLHTSLLEAHLQHAQADPSQARADRRRAMEVVEGSKSRLLTELVGRGDLPAPPTIPAKQAARERQVADALTLLDTAQMATHGRPGTAKGGGLPGSVQQRKRHVQELEDLWKEMAQSGPEAEDYVALRRGDPPGWEELAGLASDLGSESALLSLFTSAARTLLFVVRQGWEQPALVEADVDGGMWADITRRFLEEIHDYDRTGRRRETWDGFLRPLMEKASGHLGGVRRIIFAPEAFGHLLPWSVVAWRAGLREPDGLAVPLVTVPALGILPRLRRRPAGVGSGALVVGDPRGDLEHARREAREVADRFGTDPIIGDGATREAVLESLADASLVHLATHAGFVPGSPLDSGIELADGVLTAREVMSHRLQADLMVLSACQTGMAGPLAGDELAGLAQAFLQAGARSLLVSLWSVDDPATAALMTAFYGARKGGADKSVALSQAMAEVRAIKKWSHPYFWGAFLLMGDWA